MSKDKKNIVTEEKLRRYFSITFKALSLAKKNINKARREEAEIILDMSERYYKDALWFKERDDLVNAFACLNYSHGWLDTGSKLGIFLVKDTKLFVVK